jgi:hypothetical protein
MGRWLAIGAVVGFAGAVLLISVLGGPGDQAPAPPPAPVTADAGATVVPAIEAPLALPSAAARRLGAMGPAMVVDRAGPSKAGDVVEAVPDAGRP